MEIKIENKTIRSFREISRQIKKIQETAETVVPDTNDDIGKIVSTNTELYLKSKEVSGRSVLIGGEAEISVLYITEGESAVSFLRTTSQQVSHAPVQGVIACTVVYGQLHIDLRDLHITHDSVAPDIEQLLIVRLRLPERFLGKGQRATGTGDQHAVIGQSGLPHIVDLCIVHGLYFPLIPGLHKALVFRGGVVADEGIEAGEYRGGEERKAQNDFSFFPHQ